MKNTVSQTRKRGIILACVIASAGAGLVTAACSSSGGSSGNQASPDGSTSSSGGSGSGSSSGGTSGDGGAGACANPTVQLVFSPMYSAYIKGDNTHSFQVPVVTTDGQTATWSLSDPTQGTLMPQTFDGQPGVLITVSGTGDSQGNINVIATESNGSCGQAVLHITSNTTDDWNVGNARYNDGTVIQIPGRPDGGGGGFGDGGRPEGGFGGGGGGGFGGDGGSIFEVDGGTACTNCHGPTANNIFNDVAHTPEQTAGFSDDDLAAIIINGIIPDGGYFDPSVLVPGCTDGGTCAARAYRQWHRIHQWNDITPQELPGVICYLRSLTPAPQMGTSNFGGRRDGGAPPPPPPLTDASAD